jgi:hypothetical protein
MKKLIPILSFMLLIIFDANILFAQSQEDMQKWTAYMTPGDMHQMLAKLDGTWNEDMTMWEAPNTPPQKLSATCENKMIMGGRYQEARHSGSFNNMPFEGYSLIGYDNIKKVFESTWIDNMSTGTIRMQGTYDPSTKMVTLMGKEMDPMSGQEIDIKQTIQFIDDNNQLVQMFSNRNGQESKVMEIKLTRKS